MGSSLGIRTNPYVGPRAFRYGERIYGRPRETEELLNLLIAERIVLLYSPSGAGKTSLIQAALIPALKREGFTVLPVIRVGQVPSLAAANGNRYLLSALSSLELSAPADKALPPEQLAAVSFAEYIERYENWAGKAGGTVLIFDQFEEILTLDPLDQEEKKEFFQQVGIALRDPGRWALFSMREDHIAGLDSFLLPVPTRLKSTFRLELLTAESALWAIQKPASEQGVDFTYEAASKLVDDLRQMAVQTPDGTMDQRPGPYVEPVQLQVVCYRIWEKLPPDDNVIDPDNLASVGDVDTALADYYAERVRLTAEQTGVSERLIREWFDRELITEGGLRGQVLKGREGTRGLGEVAIRKLQDMHLIRGEERRGATWLELSHDRLLRPIRADNTVWFERNLNFLQKRAAEWQRQGKPDSLCLHGRELAKSKHFASANPAEVAATEREFLTVCESHQRTARWRRMSLVQIPVILLIALLAALSLWNYNKASKNAEEASKYAKEASNYARIVSARSTSLRALALLDEQPDLALIFASEAEQRVSEADPNKSEVLGALFSAALYNPRLRKFLHGHPKPVGAVACSPDGKLLATGDYDGKLVIWESDTWHSKRVFAARPKVSDAVRSIVFSPYEGLVSDAVRSIAFSPDGKYMAVCSKDHSIVLWDRNIGRSVTLQKKGDHPEDVGTVKRNVFSLAFSSDSTLLVSGDNGGRVIVWDVAKRTHCELRREEPGGIRAVAFNPSGQMLAAAGDGSKVTLWKRDGNKWCRETYPTQEQGREGNMVMCLGFSPDGALLAAGSNDGRIYVRDIEAKSWTSVKTHEDRVTSLSFNRRGDRLITSSFDGTLRLWKVPSMDDAGPPFTGHIGQVLCASFWHDAQTGAERVVSGGMDHKIIVWDPALSIAQPVRKGLKRSPFCYTFSPDGSCEVGGYKSGAIVIRFRKSGRWVELADHHPERVLTAAFSRNGRFLITSSYDGTVLVHEMRDGDEVLSFPPLKMGPEVTAAAISDDGTRIAIAKGEGKVTLWGRVTGAELGAPLDSFTSALFSLAFSPDGNSLAGSGDEDFAVQWNLTSGTLSRFPDVHVRWVQSVAYSQDGTMLVTASADNTLLLWDAKSTKQLSPPLTGHHAPVVTAVFSRDGKWLASGSEDNSVLLWDVSSRRHFGPRLLHFDTVRALNFSPDGKFLFSGSYPGDTAQWPLDPNSWRQLCHDRANRNPTRMEWKLIHPKRDYRKVWSDLPEPGEDIGGGR